MESRNLLEGNSFMELQQKAKELGAQSLEYSTRKKLKVCCYSRQWKTNTFWLAQLPRLSDT